MISTTTTKANLVLCSARVVARYPCQNAQLFLLMCLDYHTRQVLSSGVITSIYYSTVLQRRRRLWNKKPVEFVALADHEEMATRVEEGAKVLGLTKMVDARFQVVSADLVWPTSFLEDRRKSHHTDYVSN
jgi:hypothetical protein